MSKGGLAPKSGTPINYVPTGTILYRQKDRGWRTLTLLSGEIAFFEEEWWLRCPCGMMGTLEHQVILDNGKVTVEPSVVCPGGCHYHITNGVVV